MWEVVEAVKIRDIDVLRMHEMEYVYSYETKVQLL